MKDNGYTRGNQAEFSYIFNWTSVLIVNEIFICEMKVLRKIASNFIYICYFISCNRVFNYSSRSGLSRKINK